MEKKSKGIFKVFIEWWLRRKTLNSILYILVIFLIKELAALSAGDNIVEFANYLKHKYSTSTFIELFSEFLKSVFSTGSYSILLITIVTIILFLYVRAFDNNSRINPILRFIGFVGLSVVVIYAVLDYGKDAKPKINKNKYTQELRKIEEELALKQIPYAINSKSYLEHVKKTNNRFNAFLKSFNDSLITNPNYRGIAYVTAPAGYGKSYFTKKWIESEINEVKIGKIKVREHIVCEERASKCYSKSLGIKINKIDDLETIKNGTEEIFLGWLYDYEFDSKKIIEFYEYEDIDILIIDDLDEVSEKTMEKYLKDFETLMENNTFPNLNLVVFMSRPEALVNYLSNTYRTVPKVDVTYGIEQNSLNNPIFSNPSQIEDRVNNWAEWYGPEKLDRDLIQKEIDLVYSTTLSLYNKFDFIKLQLQIQSNSDFLFRSILKERIDKKTNKGKIKEILFNLMLGRNSDSHHRPNIDSNEGLIYINLMQELVLNKIKMSEIKDKKGWFLVKNNDKIEIKIDDVSYSTTVKALLNRSGLVLAEPIDSKISKYRFEPFWLHEYLINM
jgi:hypothetical protein